MADEEQLTETREIIAGVLDRWAPFPDDPCEVRLTHALLQRWYDRTLQRWDRWAEITGEELRTKYGITPDEWKQNCQAWIDIGGTYQYKIVRRTDATVWTCSYEDK